ncbi:hypothetical protein BG011_001478 [Mortierella polycephala]|uniref:Crinkler effector protein N-terminal domain-containing protein n=1 Tax=Mortierella polycephala TaxID=41804 RepID=A0A9P6PLB5_9FUNG|nr:hypothetical protein BG011_001478 [Mortierella polycephala]
MTNDRLDLFCLVSGDPISGAFSVITSSGRTVDQLRDLIKAKKTVALGDVGVEQLTLWSVLVPVAADNIHNAVFLNKIGSKTELVPTDDLSDVFEERPPKMTIHIIVQRPQPAHASVPAHVLTPFPAHLSDESRPGTPLSGGLSIDTKKIADRFFASGTPAAAFLKQFVRDGEQLPLTTGAVPGFPKAWLRKQRRDGTRPGLLFLHLPDPSTSTEPSKGLASDATLDLIRGCNPGDVLIFGVRSTTEEGVLIDIVRKELHATRTCLIEHGGALKFIDDTKLLVVYDEAQILGEESSGSFNSMNGAKGANKLTLLTSGTGLSIFTLNWAQRPGSILKHEPDAFHYLEFSGWTGWESVETYIAGIRSHLPADDARLVLGTLFAIGGNRVAVEEVGR